MIPIVEMKEAARAFGVPPSTIERDYAQNWLLAQLSTLPMALKGGTGSGKSSSRTTVSLTISTSPCWNRAKRVTCGRR